MNDDDEIRGRKWQVVDHAKELWMSPQPGRPGVWDVTFRAGDRLGSVYRDATGFHALPHGQGKPLARAYRTKEEAARALL